MVVNQFAIREGLLTSETGMAGDRVEGKNLKCDSDRSARPWHKQKSILALSSNAHWPRGIKLVGMINTYST